MAKRKEPPATVDDEDEDVHGSESGQELDELSQVLSELDSSGAAIIKVERMREGKRPEYVGDMSPSSFTLAQLQERFGGGEYALTVFDSARRYVKRTTVAIAAPLKPPAPAAVESSGFEKIASTMVEQMQAQSQLLQALLLQGRTAPAAADAATMRRQLLEEMQLMKGIMGSGQVMSPDKVLELLMKGMEIAKETGGGGDTGWTDIAGKAIDVLGEPLAALLSSSAMVSATAPVASQEATSAGALMPPVQQQKNAAVVPMLNPMVKQYVSFLVRKAAAGADPTLYAELVLDNVPEAMVREFLADPDPVTKFAQFDARVLQHAEWFRDLGQACLEALNADAAAPGSGPSPADGDAGGDT